jgi:hypothetical protein
MRMFEALRERYFATPVETEPPPEPLPVALDPTLAKPCPFCNADIVRVETIAKSFAPPRVYVEWHHAPGFCWLTLHKGRIMMTASDSLPAQRIAIDLWNERAPI